MSQTTNSRVSNLVQYYSSKEGSTRGLGAEDSSSRHSRLLIPEGEKDIHMEQEYGNLNSSRKRRTAFSDPMVPQKGFRYKRDSNKNSRQKELSLPIYGESNILRHEAGLLKDEADKYSIETKRLEFGIDLFKSITLMGLGTISTLAIYDTIIKPELKNLKKSNALRTEGIEDNLKYPKVISKKKSKLSQSLSLFQSLSPTLPNSPDLTSIGSINKPRIKLEGVTSSLSNVSNKESYISDTYPRLTPIPSNQPNIPASRFLLPPPPEVETLHGIEVVTKRRDIENRFRSSYVNEANRKGFVTIDVEVLSSNYETKPVISSISDLESGTPPRMKSGFLFEGEKSNLSELINKVGYTTYTSEVYRKDFQFTRTSFSLITGDISTLSPQSNPDLYSFFNKNKPIPSLPPALSNTTIEDPWLTPEANPKASLFKSTSNMVSKYPVEIDPWASSINPPPPNKPSLVSTGGRGSSPPRPPRNTFSNFPEPLDPLSPPIPRTKGDKSPPVLKSQKTPWMGTIGYIGLGYIGVGIALRGPEYLSYVASGVTSFITGMTTDNPYKQVILPRGHRVIPNIKASPLFTTSRVDTYAGGYRLHDVSSPSAAREDYQAVKDKGSNTLIGIGAGVGGGIGALLLDKSLSSFSKLQARRNEVFRHIFDNKVTGAFSKNFSPIIIGAVTGALTSEGDIGDRVQAAYMGGMTGSLIGFLAMKEEVGPMLHKKLGLLGMGIGAGLLLASNYMESREARLTPTPYAISKDGSLRVTYDNLPQLIEKGQGQLPPDFYQHPDAIELARAHLETNIQRTNIPTVETKGDYSQDIFIPEVEKKGGKYKTRLGHLSIGLDMKVPTYSSEEGYLRVSQTDIRERYSIDESKENPMDRAASMFHIYQAALFIPSMTLFGAGLLAEATNNPALKKIIQPLTSYPDKLRYIWPGERKIGEGIAQILGGVPGYIRKGEVEGIQRGLGVLTSGIGKKTTGEIFTMGRKAFIYAIPLSIMSTIFQGMIRNRDENINLNSDYQEISHFDSMEVLLPESTGDKDLDAFIQTQSYMGRGHTYKLGDTLIYDSGTIGQGLQNFLEVAPDKSVKALLYKLGHEEGLLEVMSRKAAIGGLGISGGDNIDKSSFLEEIGELFQGQGSWSHIFSYPLRAAHHDGFSAGLNSITSVLIGGTYNLLATNLGFDPIYNYKFDEERGNPLLARGLNTLTIGTLGAVGGMSTQALISKGVVPMKGRMTGMMLGGLIGAGLGASLPTYIDKGFYDAFLKQSQLSTGIFKEYYAHKALTGQSSKGADIAFTTALLVGTPAMVSALLPGSSKTRLLRGIAVGGASYLTGMIGSLASGNGIVPSLSEYVKSNLTQGYDLSYQTFSILPGERRDPSEQKLTHIHSKTLWSREEVFISTGNLDTVWKGLFGDESQFNIAVRIKGEKAKPLIAQLDALHSFMKSVKSSDSLEEIAMQTPDLVLGGRGSGSEGKILSFIQNAQGELWISAPYLAGKAKEVRPLVEAIKRLEAKGQNVHLIAQNPRGVSAGGQPLLSIELQQELMTAGVTIYTSPYTSKELAHAKILADDNRALVTSHNLFSGNSMNQVVEIGIILEGKEYADAVKQAALRFMIKNNYANLEDNPEYSPEVYIDQARVRRSKELGIDPQLAGLLGDRESGSLLLNSQMGVSFFYSRALYNNLQRQSGRGWNTISYKDIGIASSLYKQAYLANRNKNSFEPIYQDIETLPFFVKQFDKELLTQGLGGLFNEFIAMPLGLGRLYKDEVGFLPSLAGSIGAVLDKTYLFHTGRPISGINVREDSLDPKDQRYKERATRIGLFETLFTEAFFLGQQASSAVAFYMILGEPLNLLISEGLKTEMESLIKVALNVNPIEFSTSSSFIARNYTLGITNNNAISPLGARLNVSMTIDRTKGLGGFYGDRNTDISPYHLSNLFMRKRSGLLLNEVMKPFLLDYINPYTKSHKGSQEGFRQVVIDMIDEVSKPIELEYELVGRSSNTYKAITKYRTSLQNQLMSIGLPDVSAEIIGYQTIRTQVIQVIENTYKELGRTPPRVADLRDLSKSIKVIISSQDEELIDRFRTKLQELHISKQINNLALTPTTPGVEPSKIYTSEGKLIASMSFRITNLGQDRASAVAQRVQAILDEIPLNPLRWGMFNKHTLVGMLLGEWTPNKEYEGGYKRSELDGVVYTKVKTIGDILSFSELTEITRDLLFGKGGISSFIAEHEVYNPSNASHAKAKQIALNATDRIHSIWNSTVGFTFQAGKRIWDRYFLLMGTPFHNNGLLRSTDALKAMEYHLVNTPSDLDGVRGLSWGDNPKEVRLKLKELNSQGRQLWNTIYSLVEAGDEIEALRVLRTSTNDAALESFLLIGDRTSFINHYAATHLPKGINPLARQINVVDSSVVYAMQQVQGVEVDIETKGLGPKMHISLQEHLRNQMIGTFSLANMSGKQLAKRLIKIGPGNSFDASGKVVKNKYITNIAWGLVTSTLFLESLFTNSSGVSLVSQLGFALTTGGGLLSPLLGNQEGEMNLSTEFAGNRLLPGSGPLRYALGIATNLFMLGAAHMVGVASLREAILEYSIQPVMLKRLVGQVGADGASVDVGIKYKKSSVSEVGEILLSELVKNEWSTLNNNQIMERLKTGNLTIGGEKVEVQRLDYKWSLNNTVLASIQANVEGGQLVSRVLSFRGSVYRNTAIAYAVMALGSRTALTLTAGTLNYLRDNTGALDPIVFSAIGMLIGVKNTKSFGGGLAGMGIGAMVGGFMNKVLNQRILAIGGKGSMVNNTQGQIVAELSDFRNRVVGNLDRASRAELMAALWAGKIATAYGLLEREDSPSLVKVQAKQVVLPFLQLYLVSRTKNERRDFQGNVTDAGQTYFQVGIQGPPISGMSVGIGLPFKIIKGKGVFSLVANEEYDVIDLMGDAATLSTSIQVTALATTLLNKGVTASGRVFKRQLGSSVNPTNQIQTRRTLSIVSKAMFDTADLVEDLGLILPNTVVRMVSSLTGIEYRLLADISSHKPKLTPSSTSTPKGVRLVSYIPSGVKTISGIFIGGALGQIAGASIGASISDNFDLNTWTLGGAIGGGAGVGLYQIGRTIAVTRLSNLPLLNNRVVRNLSKLNPVNLPPRLNKITGPAKIILGTLALGYFLSSSGSGVSIGMDSELGKQIGVTTAYATIMGSIALGVGQMGKGMSSTMETYTRLSEEINQLSTSLHSGDKPNTKFIRQMKLTLSKFRLGLIQKDAEDVVVTLVNNKAEIETRLSMSDPGSNSHIKIGKLKTIAEKVTNSSEVLPSKILNIQTAKDITSELKEIKGSFLEGRFRNRVFARRLWRTMKVPIIASIAGGIAHSLNPDINIDSFLNNIEGIAEGQSRYRARLKPGQSTIESVLKDVAADTFKLIFLKDRDTNSRVMLDKVMRNGEEYGGQPDAALYSKLLNTNKGLLEDLNTIHSEISGLFVLDDPNSFISVGIIGGTFRRKEYGTTMTPYVQLQASNSDVSVAAYSMASSYLFKSMIGGKNDFLFTIQNSMRIMNRQTEKGLGNDSRVLRLTALKLLSGTAKLQPRAKARRISRIAEGVLDAVTKDSLLSSIMKHRVDMNKNINMQPYESLISRLLKEQANPSNRYLDRMMQRILKGESGVIDKVTAMFMGDPFFMTARNFNITNIKFFGKDKASGGIKEIQSNGLVNTGEVWDNQSSPYLGTYIKKSDKSIGDNPVVQLLGRIFNTLPGPLGFIIKMATITAVAISSISYLHSLGSTGEARVLATQIDEYFNKDWFGRVTDGNKTRYVWQVKYALPNIGDKTYIGGTPPLLYKGSYMFQLNQAFFSRNVREAFNEIQEQLDKLINKGWGVTETISAKGVTTKQGYGIVDYLVNIKEKELKNILEDFNKLPSSFQDIQEGNNSFTYDRGKNIHQNLERINQVIDSGVEENFRLKLEEDRLKLMTQIEALSGTSGSERLIGKLTEAYSNEIDIFVDRYIETLTKKEITIDRAYLQAIDNNSDILESMNSKWSQVNGRSQVKVSAISLFASNATLPQLVDISDALRDDIDKGLLVLINHMSDEQKKAFMIGDTPNIKAFLKAKARADIEAAIRRYVEKGVKDPQDVIRFLLKVIGGETPELTNMSVEVLGALTGIKGNKDSFFNRMRHHWGGLARSPGIAYKNVLERSISKFTTWIRGVTAPPYEMEASGSSFTAHPYLISHTKGTMDPNEVVKMIGDNSYIDKVARAQAELADREGITSKTVKAGGLLWEIYGLVNDTVEALNVFSAYSNLGDSYSNRNLSEAQRLNYAYDAGMVTANLMFSIGIMTTGVHLGMTGISTLMAGTVAAGSIASIVIPLLVGTAVVGVSLLGYNVLPEKYKTKVKRGINGVYEGTGRAIKATSDFAYQIGSSMAGDKGGALAARSTLGVISGALAGVTAAVTLATFSPISMLLFSSALVSASTLGTAALVGLGIGALVGLGIGAVGGGKIINSWMDKLSKVKIGSNQILRPFINRPGDWLAMKNIQPPIRSNSTFGSPLEVSTVSQAIQSDYSNMLNSAGDMSGGSSASLFLSPTIYGGTVGEMNPHMRKYGHTSVLRPGGVTDPLLDREMKVRGQMFNQTIIGRYTWGKILATSLNVREVKRATEAYMRSIEVEQRRKQTVEEVKKVVNDLKVNEITPQILKKGKVSEAGVEVVNKILGVKEKIDKAKEAKASKSKPLKVTMDMGNVNDREREFEKDVKVAAKEVTLISEGNTIRVVPTMESTIKQAAINPITATIV